MFFVGENCGQKAHKSFSGKFGKIQAKILRTPKTYACSYTYGPQSMNYAVAHTFRAAMKLIVCCYDNRSDVQENFLAFDGLTSFMLKWI